MKITMPIALAFAIAIPAVSLAQSAIKSQRVQFARGASSATIKGTIKGSQTLDYVIGARAGQTMTVNLKTAHTATYFNVLPPGSNDVAIHVGSTAGNSFKGNLAAGGDYKVRVYMMRSAARRNEVANYTLVVGVTGRPAAKPSAPASTDAKVPGTPYHATTTVPCRSAAGQPMGSCMAGVIRKPGGQATVHLDTPDGGERYIYFTGTKATSSNASAPLRVQRQGDVSIISIGQYERYDIPDMLIVGG